MPFVAPNLHFSNEKSIFLMQKQFFDEKVTWNSHSRTRILFDAPTSPTSTPNQHLEEKSTFVRLLFHRIVICVQGFSVKVPIANVNAKSTFWWKTSSLGALDLAPGSWQAHLFQTLLRVSERDRERDKERDSERETPKPQRRNLI